MNNWSIEDTFKDLTDEEKAVLNAVLFPMALNRTKRLQKKILKIPATGLGGYVDNPRPSIEDIQYRPVPRSVAKYQTNLLKNYTPENFKSKSTSHEYIDQTQLDDEVKWLLSKFATPRPTPSMKSAAKPEKKKVEKKEDKPKGLSPKHKKQAKEMYADAKDAGEIAEALGIDVKRVIEYLKTL